MSLCRSLPLGTSTIYIHQGRPGRDLGEPGASTFILQTEEPGLKVTGAAEAGLGLTPRSREDEGFNLSGAPRGSSPGVPAGTGALEITAHSAVAPGHAERTRAACALWELSVWRRGTHDGTCPLLVSCP